MTMGTNDWPPTTGDWEGVDWIDAGEDVWISRPAEIRYNATEKRLGSWWAARGSGLATIFYGEPHHTLVSAEPLTVTPSILVRGGRVQRHGYITDGRWVPASDDRKPGEP
jgi:hypothetical protein